MTFVRSYSVFLSAIILLLGMTPHTIKVCAKCENLTITGSFFCIKRFISIRLFSLDLRLHFCSVFKFREALQCLHCVRRKTPRCAMPRHKSAFAPTYRTMIVLQISRILPQRTPWHFRLSSFHYSKLLWVLILVKTSELKV